MSIDMKRKGTFELPKIKGFATWEASLRLINLKVSNPIFASGVTSDLVLTTDLNSHINQWWEEQPANRQSMPCSLGIRPVHGSWLYNDHSVLLRQRWTCSSTLNPCASFRRKEQ